MKTLILVLSLTTLSALPMIATPDAEDCADNRARQPGGSWGHYLCNNSCGTATDCDPANHTIGNKTYSYCACNGTEPTCCHIRLVSTDMGPFVPKAHGDCGGTCPSGSTCVLKSTGGADNEKKPKCENTTPGPPPS